MSGNPCGPMAGFADRKIGVRMGVPGNTSKCIFFNPLRHFPCLGHGAQRAFLDCSVLTGGKTWNEGNSTVYPPESPSCFCPVSLVLPRSQSMDRHDKPPCKRQTSS